MRAVIESGGLSVKALLLSHKISMQPGGGGQQQCTREYCEVLEAAGFDLAPLSFDTDRSLLARLRRRMRPAPYSNLIPEEFFARVASAVDAQEPEFVFCNLYNFVPYGPRLRKALPRRTKLVLLSHGLASVDEVHAARIARGGIGKGRLRPAADDWIGQMLRVESETLSAFDHVFCLASFEVEVCRWLGAGSVSWLPRLLRTDASLDWKPLGDRVGIVGTLDHPPNLEGAELFCAALAAVGPGRLRVRIVTNSREVACGMAARYPFVDDLGPLLEPGAIEAEAATWSAFVHPIFCYAMGCSTKTATGLNWGLPVLTTAAGLRGYVWRHGNLALSESPADLARAALGSLDLAQAALLRGEALRVVRSAPALLELTVQVRRDLGLGAESPTDAGTS